jgi:hypothetical protein
MCADDQQNEHNNNRRQKSKNVNGTVKYAVNQLMLPSEEGSAP